MTGHPEILGGRVKTLHPRIHGGILARLPGDRDELEALHIEPFDLVVTGLYPFEAGRAAGAESEALIELIDIGGPAMIRAAAKNFARVTVLTEPDQYGPFLEELQAEGGISLATRRRLAQAECQKSGSNSSTLRAVRAGPGKKPENCTPPGRSKNQFPAKAHPRTKTAKPKAPYTVKDTGPNSFSDDNRFRCLKKYL